MIRCRARACLPALALLIAMSGCGRNGASPGSVGTGTGEHEEATNRVPIPPAVRKNLGITFATVEPRRVEKTLRVPGRFEYLPTARREYRAMLPGRVELRVGQFDRVEAGAALYEVDSPAWRELQQELTEKEAQIQRLGARLTGMGPLREAHRAHAQRLRETIEIRLALVEHLAAVADAGGGRRQELNAARDAVSTAQTELAEVMETEAKLEAEEAETRANLSAAEAGRALLLAAASSLVRTPVAELTAEDESGGPAWASLGTVTVRAEAPGVVESIGLSSGSWAEEGSAVVTVVQPDGLRFRGTVFQSDLGVLGSGLPARIVPPTPTESGRSVPMSSVMEGSVCLGLSGDAASRTLDVFVVPESLRGWARAGVWAQLEIVTDRSSRATAAIPLAAVQRDGLKRVIFRRDPEDPGTVIRLEADLGRDDGRWVEVLSGVRIGDEVVLDGGFQLLLGTGGSTDRGGHFHADGTFHGGED